MAKKPVRNKSSREIRRMREQVLKSHGIELDKSKAKKARRTGGVIITPMGKTLLMLLLEAKSGLKMEEMLMQPGLEEQEIADQLGIQQPTVSVWRKRLGLRK